MLDPGLQQSLPLIPIALCLLGVLLYDVLLLLLHEDSHAVVDGSDLSLVLLLDLFDLLKVADEVVLILIDELLRLPLPLLLQLGQLTLSLLPYLGLLLLIDRLQLVHLPTMGFTAPTADQHLLFLILLGYALSALLRLALELRIHRLSVLIADALISLLDFADLQLAAAHYPLYLRL